MLIDHKFEEKVVFEQGIFGMIFSVVGLVTIAVRLKDKWLVIKPISPHPKSLSC